VLRQASTDGNNAIQVGCDDDNRTGPVHTHTHTHYLANREDLEQLATAEELDGIFVDESEAEQPRASSKASRYIALKNVDASTNGAINRIVRDLNATRWPRTSPSGAC
jgi:hypothetical protein